MTDYTRLELSRAQRVRAIALGCAVSFAAAWLASRHPVVSAAAAPAGWLYPRLLRDRLLRKRRSKLRLHFNSMLQVLSSLLSAGRSVENAFLSLERELTPLIADPASDLLREVRTMGNRIRNGEPLEGLLRDFSRRAALEEVTGFAEAFAVCKRAGGDLVDIVRRTAGLIGERLEVELEVAVMIAQKRFEARIMMGMPFAFIGFLGFFAPEYMAPLHQGAGWLLLAVCLALLGLCCWWMTKIMRIEV
ncbi:type II secretion system F family protein [Cohnella caldifontis]|uniref:type II secretion system F family protein n=1 Tax=Cohnella caldifontis TaxID=3027471 RepID=UPI0023EE2807|nr:type II secretion system F family protein [Cohnella sp. YIM B05605]